MTPCISLRPALSGRCGVHLPNINIPRQISSSGHHPGLPVRLEKLADIVVLVLVIIILPDLLPLSLCGRFVSVRQISLIRLSEPDSLPGRWKTNRWPLTVFGSVSPSVVNESDGPVVKCCQGLQVLIPAFVRERIYSLVAVVEVS
jgi:hypothetical protein